jgi:hypothetical protein
MKTSPKAHNIIAELLKIKQETVEVTLHKIVCKIWKKEIIPEQWEDGFICPIHEKGHQPELNNYREISLLNTGYQFFLNITYESLQPYMENIVGKYLCRFRKGDSGTVQVQSIRRILEKTSE